jgi:hypothetical protein
MKKISLRWSNLFSIEELYVRLKNVDSYRNPVPEMENYGFYMYLDKKSNETLYIGQAYNKKRAPLHNRIRWEIVKDGSKGTVSAFHKKCIKYGVNKKDMNIKVAHICYSNYDVDQYLMNSIERAIIYERACNGDPLMNETGKKRYKLGPIEITNKGNHSPLPNRINL